jgi:hypothetical protein
MPGSESLLGLYAEPSLALAGFAGGASLNPGSS